MTRSRDNYLENRRNLGVYWVEVQHHYANRAHERMATMTLVHAVTGIVVFVVVVGIIGYALADYLDKKYGTDDC